MKASGYIVSVQLFVAADPNFPATMTKAFETMGIIEASLGSLVAATGIRMSHQFVRRHEIPDEPKAAEAAVGAVRIEPLQEAYESVTQTDDGKYVHGPERMPPVPAALRRT